MKSIRASLILGSVLGTIAIFSLAGVAVYRGAKSTLVRQLDASLEEQARVIASVVKRTPDGMEVEIGDLDVPEYTSTRGHEYLEVWLDADSVLYRSPRLEGHDLEAVPSPVLKRSTFRWMSVAGGVHARAIDLRTEAVVDSEDWQEAHQAAPPAPLIHLVAAVEASSIDSFLARLRALLVTIVGLGGLSVAVVLAVVVRRSLRPLDELAHEIGNLRDDDLSMRVVVLAAPREMEPVVGQLNELLERVEDSFQRERTLSSDIAHELRTPLAGLRSTIEVAVSRPRTETDYRETLEGLLDIVRRVQTMVETLLYLGRLDAGQVEVEQRGVDVSQIVRAMWAPLAKSAETKRIAVTLETPDEMNVTSDPVLLQVAIRNVLDNGVAYADEGGHIRIEVAPGSEKVSLHVANSGSRIPQERVGELLRRFTRADPSRAASAEHFGLGLALASRIAAAMGCQMEVTSRVGGEFQVTFVFERAPCAQP